MTTNLAAWNRLLDAFERSLDADGEDAADEPFEHPPGPPPPEVVERARLVLERQRAGISGLLAARENVARELAAIRRIPSTQIAAPIYLDVES
ncbi:hypothetical protein AB1K56_04515 [Microbacterium sp. BWR-S6Y]|uniref:hypothetical protein n=1 Tax=Microbacterium sp. BWR-S6Y TaxID=3232073 RepID=UPI0035276B40